MGGRFGKYGDTKKKARLRRSERVKRMISTPKTSPRRRDRFHKHRNRRPIQ